MLGLPLITYLAANKRSLAPLAVRDMNRTLFANLSAATSISRGLSLCTTLGLLSGFGFAGFFDSSKKMKSGEGAFLQGGCRLACIPRDLLPPRSQLVLGYFFHPDL
jgi:hypothetical protein